MRIVEGLLRYDRLDMGEWCFDMGDQIIPIESGIQPHIQFLDDQFQSVRLLETPDGELTVAFGGRKRNEPLYITLEKGKRYPAKLPAKTVDDLLDSARLHELEHELQREKNNTNARDDDVFYF